MIYVSGTRTDNTLHQKVLLLSLDRNKIYNVELSNTSHLTDGYLKRKWDPIALQYHSQIKVFQLKPSVHLFHYLCL